MKYILNTGRYALSFEIEKGGLKKTIALDRRRLTFKVVVYDDNGIVGQGTHERFVIDEKKFAQKMEAKKQ